MMRESRRLISILMKVLTPSKGPRQRTTFATFVDSAPNLTRAAPLANVAVRCSRSLLDLRSWPWSCWSWVYFRCCSRWFRPLRSVPSFTPRVAVRRLRRRATLGLAGLQNVNAAHKTKVPGQMNGNVALHLVEHRRNAAVRADVLRAVVPVLAVAAVHGVMWTLQPRARRARSTRTLMARMCACCRTARLKGDVQVRRRRVAGNLLKRRYPAT